MMRFWFLLNVLFLALITPAEVHICQAGLAESAMLTKICINDEMAETEMPVAAQAVGIYSAIVPLLLVFGFGLSMVCWLLPANCQPYLVAQTVPTPPPRL
jgi:hypothetical protein